MEIESFIKARLAQLEAGVMYSQMNINGIDVNRQIRNDIKATRKLLELLFQLETYAHNTVQSVQVLLQVRKARRVIASRWRDHKDFQREWLSD